MLTHKRHELSKWDDRFLRLAEHIAEWSKGPRKRVGSVIVRPNRTVAATGYNGAPPGFDDELFLSLDREAQHEIVIHAEDNAIAFLPADDIYELNHAHRYEFQTRFRLKQPNPYTLYVSPLFPCEHCAHKIIEANIRRVVAYCGHISPDWLASAELAYAKLTTAGIETIFVEGDEHEA